MINHEDCQVEVPMLKDDVQSGSDSSWGSTSPSQSISPFLSTLRVAREIGGLLKTLKTPSIPSGTLEFHDVQFNSCMASFPAHHQIQRAENLDPHALTSILYLQNARLLLHRHNLSVMCAPETRSAAIDRCFLVAQDTSHILSRCLIDLPPGPPNELASGRHTWAWLFKNAANGFTCTHFWRCTLFLCLRGDFSAAATCVRASAIVGDARPVNVACGKYVAFFLEHLTQKWHQDPGIAMDKDEETLAYVSGDMQGSVDHSWVWQDDEDAPGRVTSSPNAMALADGETTSNVGADSHDGFGRAGWEAVLAKLERRLDQKSSPRNKPPNQVLSRPEDLDRISSFNHSNSAHPPGLSTASSRISIADIM